MRGWWRSPILQRAPFVAQETGEQSGIMGICFCPYSNAFPVLAQPQSIDNVYREARSMGLLRHFHVIGTGRFDSQR
ncbi:hypothetical protein D3C75_1017570 [compost metagenome]